MVDEDRFVRETTRHYGFTEEEAFAARDLLNLRPKDLVVRFNGLADFAKKYGVSLRALAEFVAKTTSGIEPWEPSKRHSDEDWKKIDEAMEGFGGDWAAAILSLRNEIERLRGNSTTSAS